jgi:Tfp pilus assembly protein PilF
MINRALLLLQRSRYDLAEQELRQALAENPENAHAHALLAYSLAQQDKNDEAESSARHAIELAPDNPYCHYIMGWVKVQRDDLQGARWAVEEAIRLNPEDSDYHGLRALIYLGGQRWQEALDAANEGLRHDPTHQDCLNHRAMALVQLNRPDEAHQTIGQALQENPENEQTHANLGWAFLHKGQHQKALEHFSEALRLDPNFDYARHGLVEALKARYTLYRWLLRFFLWMSTLSPRARGGLIIGAYILVKVLGTLGKRNPAVAPFVLPIVIFYAIFVLLTWVIDPMFNLLLQCNKYGRYALSKKQRRSSTLFGVLLFGAIASVIAGLVTGLVHFFVLAINLALPIIPATHMFKDQEGHVATRTLIFVIVQALVGTGAVVAFSLGQKEAAIACTILSLLAVGVFTWFGAIFGLRRQKV